jgi:hypothetical protein
MDLTQRAGLRSRHTPEGDDDMHTKGPWKIATYINYYGFSIHTDARGCIAERWYERERTEEYDREMQANARLIAASPMLYEACKAAIPIIGKDLNPTDNPAFAVLDLLRAAIQRAEKGD